MGGKKDNSSTGKSKLSVDQYRKRLGNREKHQLHGRHKPREFRHKEMQTFHPSQQFQKMWWVLILLIGGILTVGYLLYAFSVLDFVIPYIQSILLPSSSVDK